MKRCGRSPASTATAGLIKGQVFLGKTEQTWEDLWDMDGEITPAVKVEATNS